MKHNLHTAFFTVFLGGLLVSIHPLAASSLLSRGQELYLNNKPREASVVLEQALAQDSQDERIYLYLGIVYEQLQEIDKSIEIMKRGLSVATTLKPALYFNIGNDLFRRGQYALAEQMYSQAITLNEKLAAAWLNRANARLKIEDYGPALADYIQYLTLEPLARQRSQIEHLIDLLKGLLAEQERVKQEKLAKQRALMSDVLHSLQNASSDAKNVSAGSEKVKVQFQDEDIED